MTEIEDRWRDLGEFIREQRRVGQLSLRKLSEMAGISNPYLSQIERGLRKPSAEILRQIAVALQISAETLYIRAGILDERDGEHDLVADIHRDPYLAEHQKKNLVHIYVSFRAAFLADLVARGLPLPGTATEPDAGPSLDEGEEPDDGEPVGDRPDGPDPDGADRDPTDGADPGVAAPPDGAGDTDPATSVAESEAGAAAEPGAAAGTDDSTDGATGPPAI